MRRITYFLTVLLSLISYTSANDVALPDLERAMMSLVAQVRSQQTLIFPHIDTSPSAIKHGDCGFPRSVLSAVVPSSELTEARNDPKGFAKVPFSQRRWYEGLPADVKEYLRAMEEAKKEITGRTQLMQQDGKGKHRFRGVGWWWESR